MAIMRPRAVTECGKLIIQRALDASTGRTNPQHPTVLSCGGIFVPRPRPLNPRDPLYHILNIPSEGQPVKVVSALIHRNILQEVLSKDSLN
ncbi:MAG: hypothetical protein HY543_09185 [Deltaproteobacteria bacterium]|nr:hypothetical protein [Deltaproteobacteria bacterium]